MIKKIQVVLVPLALVLLISGCGGPGGESRDNQAVVNASEENLNEADAVETVEAYNDLMEDVANKNNGKVKASCNVIAASSNCVDYVGAYWENIDYAKLNCEGRGDLAERIFSKNGCPYADFGGCKTGVGTIMENIIWFYPEGGGEYNRENIQYAMSACNAVVGSQWTTPDKEFLK